MAKVHKCFLCTGEIQIRTRASSNFQENSTFLCKILGLPQQGLDLKCKDNNIEYCRPCFVRIANIRDMLNDMKRLEKRLKLLERNVLDEKQVIMDQLAEKFSEGDDEPNSQSRGFSYEFRNKITAGCLAAPNESIGKMKQVDRQLSPNRHVESTKALTSQSQNGGHGRNSGEDHCATTGRKSDKLVEPSEVSPPPSLVDLDSHDSGVVMDSSLSGVSSDPHEQSDALSLSKCSAAIDSVDQDVDGNESDADSDVTMRFEVKYQQFSEDSPNGQTFVCGTCGECFDRYDKLSIHSDTHTEKRTRSRSTKGRKRYDGYECEECGRILSSRCSWKQHVLQVHRKDYKFNCTVCNFGCRKKSQFDDHKLTHSDVRNFKCHLCPVSFKQKKGLDRHLKIHTRKK